MYKTDFLAGQQGHFVLRLPVRYCELNPIELVWANCKNFVARNNTTYKLSDVKQLINASFGRITPAVWDKCEEHVQQIEESYWKTDLVDESTIQPVVINVESSESDSDECDIILILHQPMKYNGQTTAKRHSSKTAQRTFVPSKFIHI